LIPAAKDRSKQERGNRFPYVAKKRHGWSGERVVIIQTEADESKHAPFLSGEDTLYQDCIDGTDEYCAHFLIHDGDIRFQRTIRHEMARTPIVKGSTHFRSGRFDCPVLIRFSTNLPHC
jgi:hypothetical protein